MLLINIPRLLGEKGISTGSAFLKSIGFRPNAASKLLRHQPLHLSYSQIEKLCLALHCTPNDLFEWQPADGDAVSHPMHALIRSQKPGITALLRNLPPDKIDEVRALMMRLQEEAENSGRG